MTDDLQVSAVPEPLLGFRVWQVGRFELDGYFCPHCETELPSGVLDQFRSGGGTAWPATKPLRAECSRYGAPGQHTAPDPSCHCGIYATYDLGTAGSYMYGGDSVLGLVYGWSKVIPGSHGFRAEFAKPACLFLLARDFAIPLDDLRQLAAYYRVPVLRPHTTDLREYRKVLNGDPLDYELDQLLAEGDFPDPISQELRNQPTHSPVRSWTPPPAPPPPQLPARSLSRGDKVEYRGSQYEVADSAWTDYARDGGATVTLKPRTTRKRSRWSS
jgi:hypothetical protein